LIRFTLAVTRSCKKQQRYPLEKKARKDAAKFG
jgi:hypothetical protein